MKNKKKIIIICLIMIILAIVISLGVKLYLNKDLENQRQKLQETQEKKYGWVEKETVDVLVAKFNTEIVDSSSLNPASTDYLTEDNNQYWYGLIDGIYLVVVPEKYTGDKSTEIVEIIRFYMWIKLANMNQMPFHILNI